jgi:site-specific recombinase XerD
MTRDILPISAGLPADLRAEIEGAQETLAAARSASTRKAYASDWTRFCDFCEARNVEALPAHPDIVALFAHVEAEAGIALVTIGRRIAAINHHHCEVGLAPPSACDVSAIIPAMLAGVRRAYAREKARKAPARSEVLTAMLLTIEGDGVREVRDRAILALGMAGAFRRSEIAAMQYRDLKFMAHRKGGRKEHGGVRITIPRSKGDQEGEGQVVAIPEGRIIRPVALLQEWLEIAGKAIARLVKATAAAAGLDPALYSAHSLRSSFL